MKFNNEIHKIHEISNFKEMINYTVEHYPDNIAYKFKKNFIWLRFFKTTNQDKSRSDKDE